MDNTMDDGHCLALGSVYQGGGSGSGMAVFKSTDEGTSWSRVTLSTRTGVVHSIAVDPTDPEIVYAGGWYEGTDWTAALFKTTDGGSNWTEIRSPISGAIYAVCIDPFNASKIYAGTTEGVYVSTDAGSNWRFPFQRLSVKCMVADPREGDRLFVGTSTGVYASEDGGVNWGEMNEGLLSTDINCIDFDPISTTLYVGTRGGGVLRCTPGAVRRRIEVISATTTLAAQCGCLTPLELRVVLAGPPEDTGIFPQMRMDLSALGLGSAFPLQHEGAGEYTFSTAITPSQRGRYYLPVMVETAEGDHWYRLFTAALTVYPDDLIIYEDGPGEGWTVEVTGSAESDTNATAFVHNGSFSHAILVPTGVKYVRIRYVFDGPEGLSLFGYSHLELWINIGEGSGQDPTIAGKKLSHLGIVPELNTWTLVSIPVSELADPLTSVLIGGFVQDTFYIDDMKLVAMKLPEPSAAAEPELDALPSDYRLSQNYPNPFNPTTTIAYHLPEASHVSLDIYNITGQHIATLVSEYQKPARYTVSWDASGYANGLYFVRLEAGSFIQTRRMAHLK